MPVPSRQAALLCVTLLLACQGSTAPGIDCSRLATAPQNTRVDLVTPTFSNPLIVTNPLFPISRLHSAVLLGTVDGLPFRTETTLMPAAKSLTVNGRQVRANESQYVAWLGGRLHEVALDWYVQADDGAVWYLGEDVFNYADGVVVDREGTWQVDKDGPAAMIMPASPKVGDVFRPENICGVVFEEVTVKVIGRTVTGPAGPVAGAITVEELHMDGTREDKTFAPGYGEFFTGNVGGDVEAMALAVPTDALQGPIPLQVTLLFDRALASEAAATAGNWTEAVASLSAMNAAWNAFRAGTPPLLAAAMTSALTTLGDAVTARHVGRARLAAIEAARAALDFRLRHRPVAEIDRARFDLWAAEVSVDAAAGNPGFVRGDVASIDLVFSRFAHTLSGASRSQVEALLAELRAAAQSRNLSAASGVAARLRTAIAATS